VAYLYQGNIDKGVNSKYFYFKNLFAYTVGEFVTCFTQKWPHFFVSAPFAALSPKAIFKEFWKILELF